MIIENSWKSHLEPEAQKPYMKSLKSYLNNEYEKGKVIFPQIEEYYEAFNCTPYDEVRAVILGQDPYHGEGQAHGLCFSVKKGVKVPPSLKNIYKELESDLNIPRANHGNLNKWALQGVLLLNSVLTVEEGKAASHRRKGWEEFTDVVIEKLNQREKPLVFILWGNYAQKKGAFIDSKKHLVLKSAHPSPLSASRGFFGNNHFSRCNQFLKENGIPEIDWSLELS